jgi:uncharacterized membrane protein
MSVAICDALAVAAVVLTVIGATVQFVLAIAGAPIHP